MKSYDGAVLFVDMLGVSKLTMGDFTIGKKEYLAWGLEEEFSGNASLSYVIYKAFQELIVSTAKKYDVQIYLLSDNAFVWSNRAISVVKFCAEFMQCAMKNGLLCRGGLCHGGIIEEKNGNHHILLGDAVTNAVKLEGKAKGARIIMDSEIPAAVYKDDNAFSYKYQNHVFLPFVNPLDYETYDEFKWYAFPHRDLNARITSYTPSESEKYRAIIGRQKLLNMVVFSPKFMWNCLTKEGKVHIKATIKFIGEVSSLGLIPVRCGNEFVEKRNTSLLANWNKIVSSRKNYVRAKQLD